MKYCSKCGKEVHNEAVVCMGCGCKIEGGGTQVSNSLIGWGYVSAVLMPILGIIFGIIALCKGRLGNGLGIIATSLFFWFFWIGFFEALA